MGLRISKISDKPGNKAQLYHFDLDRPKWLKFFIYLNDVENLDHGPHSYIKNTHKVFAKPYKILIKRYQRISIKRYLVIIIKLMNILFMVRQVH